MNKFILFLFVIILSALGNLLSAQTLDVHISNIRNTKGQLCFAIFADEAAFKAEKTCWAKKCTKKDIINGEFHIQIPYFTGEWGFSVLDDENSNGKMDYNLIGLPREGFGFSNYYLQGIHRPVFKDFSFKIKNNEIKVLTIKLKYF